MTVKEILIPIKSIMWVIITLGLAFIVELLLIKFHDLNSSWGDVFYKAALWEKNLIYFTVLVSAMVVDVLVYDLFFPTDAKNKELRKSDRNSFFGLIIALIAISFCHFILIEKDHIHFYIDDVKMPLSKEQALQFSCYAAIIYAFIVTILSRMRISHKIR
jgi:hypothetical protein